MLKVGGQYLKENTVKLIEKAWDEDTLLFTEKAYTYILLV
jgi:hypothetical protein